MVPKEANSALGYVITKENAAFQSQNDIHIIETECTPVYLSNPFLNDWSNHVFTASLRKHF